MDCDCCVVDSDDEGRVICHCPLHAAAPQLLAAMRNVLPWAEKGIRFSGDNAAGRDHVTAARAAIAKAEGR